MRPRQRKLLNLLQSVAGPFRVRHEPRLAPFDLAAERRRLHAEAFVEAEDCLRRCRSGDIDASLRLHEITIDPRISVLYSPPITPAAIGSDVGEIESFVLRRDVMKGDEWLDECRMGNYVHAVSLLNLIDNGPDGMMNELGTDQTELDRIRNRGARQKALGHLNVLREPDGATSDALGRHARSLADLCAFYPFLYGSLRITKHELNEFVDRYCRDAAAPY